METSIARLLGWRDYLHLRRDKVRGDAEAYCDRAQEIRELVAKTLSGGLTDAASYALGDLAEGDIVDFCVMVDLANGVEIPDVEPLDDDTREWLMQWRETEPWRALTVDTDINVCLAMLRAHGQEPDEIIWHMGDPHLLRTISQVFEQVDREQYARFVVEINVLVTSHKYNFDSELLALLNVASDNAAHRIGVEPKPIGNG